MSDRLSQRQFSDSGRSRIYNGLPRPYYTPESISSLESDEVFVFGSNLQGHHGGGAARYAMMKFGAVWGRGVGLLGQSYAIPTMQGGVETIRPYVDRFIAFAQAHKELFFYVTRIGCGIAGFKDSEIAPLFKDAVSVDNICLPEQFVNEITVTPQVPKEYLTMMHGQVRTLIDLLKELNRQESITDWNKACERLTGLVSRNVRYGDPFAFMAIRTIWSLISRHDTNGDRVDLDLIGKEMFTFHDWTDLESHDQVQKILFDYSAEKLIKYIQFLNEFRRYTNYPDLRNDLGTIHFSHCSKNDPDYYFSFYGPLLDRIKGILSAEWEDLTENGVLSNKLLEDVVYIRHGRMVNGTGCHPDLQVPDDMSFEMRFAKSVLDHDDNYSKIRNDRGGTLYIPVSDHSLPVYDSVRGKLQFDSLEEKENFIRSASSHAD